MDHLDNLLSHSDFQVAFVHAQVAMISSFYLFYFHNWVLCRGVTIQLKMSGCKSAMLMFSIIYVPIYRKI